MGSQHAKHTMTIDYLYINKDTSFMMRLPVQNMHWWFKKQPWDFHNNNGYNIYQCIKQASYHKIEVANKQDLM